MNNASQITALRQPETIRKKAKLLFELVLENKSDYLSLDLTQLEACSALIISLIKQDYPQGDIPFHSRFRHFETAGIDRIEALKSHPSYPKNKTERGRILFEIVIISVLLDAGAGPHWQYKESKKNLHLTRSEGLAIASLDMYLSGLFSDASNPFSVNASKLKALSTNELAHGFQITDANPLLGLKGRAYLLQTLSLIIDNHPEIFGEEKRLGLFYDYIVKETQNQKGDIDAGLILSSILNIFSPIWPGRIEIDSLNMGDVWRYENDKSPDTKSILIPFHKLSQWLTYSLLEPLQWAGFTIKGLDSLTGLAEYRNGGLFIDMNVIIIKDKSLLATPLPPHHPAIIEWRALTICLLDSLWENVRHTLSISKEAFPLVKLLEAGTWKAGRKLAFEKREDGSPPIQLISDGTVF
jgi:hypothetical protein